MDKSKHSYHHGDLRAALISASMQIISTEGIDGLSLREVARIAGVSHTAPYRHFRNKAALMEAIAIEGFNSLTDEIEAVYSKFSHPRRQLVEACMSYVEFVATHPEISQMMFWDENAGIEITKASDRVLQVLARIIENGISARIFKAEDATEQALTAWSMMHGLSVLIVSGNLGKLAVTVKQRSKLASMAAENLLEGLTR